MLGLKGSHYIPEEIIKRIKLLGIHLEGRLNLDFDFNTLIKKVNKKCHAFARVYYHRKLNKGSSKCNTFITSKFSFFLFCLDVS